jgi:hypothetical protein
MTLRDAAILVVLTMLAGMGGTLAQDAAKPPFDESKFPPEVRKSLRDAHQECRREGGGKVTFAPDTVRTIDLTGDGRPDYIVSLQDAACEGREVVYCGTGGCELDILVTLPSGKIRNVFSARVRSYEILPGESAKTIRFMLHGTYCGGHGNPSCPREHTITATPFQFREPK